MRVRSDKATAIQKCVIPYRTSSDRASDPVPARQPTPPFVPPPPLEKDFESPGDIGPYEPREKPDGHHWADPDIVWRGFVPVNPDTEPILPEEIELWSNHCGLPVGLHPEYTRYSGIPYDDTFTEIDRERQERYKRKLEYIGSAEQAADMKAFCERIGQEYFPPTPSPSPVPESHTGHTPQPDEHQPVGAHTEGTASATTLPPSVARTPEHSETRQEQLSISDEPPSSDRTTSFNVVDEDDSSHAELGKRQRDRSTSREAPPPKRRHTAH